MKTRSLVATVAALTLSTLAVTAGDAFATKITPLQGKYSKIKLDGICAREGGQSYGTADTAYGCTKGNNTVECNKDGTCTGYNFSRMAPGGPGWASSAESFLGSSSAPMMQAK